MRAVLVEGAGKLTISDIPPPQPQGRAVVQVDLSGLCGTDVKILAGQIPVDHPRVLGHEVVGTVTRQGEAGLVPVGARVLVNPTSWCGHCRLCLSDHTHLCTNGALMGRDTDGGFAEQIAVDERQLHPLPDHLDDGAASVLQVLGTCVHAQTLVDALPGQSAAVIGLGVSGLLHVQLLRERGIDHIVGVTRTAWKRDLAAQFGASATAHPDEARDVVDAVTDGRGADLVIEAAGSSATLNQAVELATIGGRILAFGITPRVDPELPTYQLYHKELNLVSARAARSRDYALGVQLAAEQRLDLARFHTHGFSLDDVSHAFQTLEGPDALKVTLEVR